MKAKIILPIVVVIALLLYFLSNRPSPDESPSSSTPAELEATEQIEENVELVEAVVEVSPEAASALPLLRYDPTKDPLHSEEAKQAYYDRLAAYYTRTYGDHLIPNIIKHFFLLFECALLFSLIILHPNCAATRVTVSLKK